ncbi:MAG: hypothetical protein HZB79_02775 [Deltaproteobacteria bacterium]|nr:hypothetical protein [Deltaproteobacteria bacterium]
MYMNEGNMATAFMGAFGLFFVFLWVVLLILWIILPFYIFGIKGIMKDILEEQKKTNELLKDMLYKKNAADISTNKTNEPKQD